MLLVAAVALAGCGAQGRDPLSNPGDEVAATATATATPTPTATETPTPTTPPEGDDGDVAVVERVRLRIGAEGLEPPVVTVPAFLAVELTLVNRTAVEEAVTVAGSEPLTVPAGRTRSYRIEGLEPGEHRIVLQGTPFEGTLRVAE